MYKAYVFRMYPDENQKILIEKSFGVSRWTYNHFLEEKQREYKETGKSKSIYDECKEIPKLIKEYPFLKEVDSCLIRNSIFNLSDSYKRFFDKISGYPNFKSKGIKDLVITSHNEKIENTLEVKTLIKKIKGLQKGLARSKPRSKNRYKIKLKIQKVYQKNA